jgi:vacuolar-type H+-ATPase subunit H
MHAAMRPELETIVAADEEARSRLSSAEERARRDTLAVREEVERRIAERGQTAEAALETELAAIRGEGERAANELRAREESYRDAVAAAAASRLEEAARRFAQIVVDGPPEGTR